MSVPVSFPYYTSALNLKVAENNFWHQHDFSIQFEKLNYFQNYSTKKIVTKPTYTGKPKQNTEVLNLWTW